MKFYKLKSLIVAALFLTAISDVAAQSINWLSQSEEKSSLLYLDVGYAFSMNTQVGYGHMLSTVKPILLTVDYSFPMGDQLFDDHKFRLGAQITVLEKNNFKLSAGYHAIVRRQETQLVRLLNIGSEFSIATGYYKPKWYVGLEVGYDQAILTHAKHSDSFRENYAAVKDAWFNGTGGYFYYGVEAGKSIGTKMNLTLSVGAIDAKGKDQNPILPVYLQIGILRKF